MKTKVLICAFTFLLACVLQVAYAGPGAIFSGDSIKLLKEQLKFKNTDGLLRYNGTNMQFSNDNGAAWSDMGSGGAAETPFEEVFTYAEGFADNHPDGTNLLTGNNVTFKTAGTFSGTFALSTTSTELYDSINSTNVFKYTSGTGTTVNNWIHTGPVIEIPQGARDNGSGFQDILVRFWYWSEFTEGSLEPRMFCENGASAGIIEHMANVSLPSTDDDEDGIKDAGEGRFYELSYGVPNDCTQLTFGFQQTAEEDSLDFIYDRLELGILPRNAVDVVGDEKNTYGARIAGNSTIVSQTGDFIASVADAGAGIHTITWKTGLFTVAPAVTGSYDGSSTNHSVFVQNVSTTGVTIATTNYSSGSDQPFSIIVERQGSDVITSNKKLIVPSADTNQAGFFGSVKWEETTGCTWTRTSTSFGDYGNDTDCDNAVRTIRGNTNVTNTDIGNADGQLPQIKFSHIPAGTIQCSAVGFLYKSTGDYRIFHRFSDGTNVSETGGFGTVSNNANTNNVIGSIHYETAQTDVTIKLQTKSTSNVSYLYADTSWGGTDGFKISCYYYPPHDRQPRINYMFPTVDYSFENEFSAKVTDGASVGTVSDENEDFIDGNCTENGTGDYTCNYVSGKFTVPPNISCTPFFDQAGDEGECVVVANSTTSVQLWLGEMGVALVTPQAFYLKASRAGSDYKKLGSQAAILNSLNNQEDRGNSFQDMFTYHEGNADKQGTANLLSGNSTTFKTGGGSLDGTFTLSTTSSELYDSVGDGQVYKYSSGTGTTLNNFIYLAPVIDIPQGARDNGSGFQDIYFKFWYWSEFSDGNIEPRVYCENGTSAGEISHVADTGLSSTDNDADGVKDANEGEFVEIAYSVPNDCTQLTFGFAQTVEEDSLDMVFDRIQVGILPRNYVDTSVETNWVSFTPTLTGTGFGTPTSATGRWRRIGDSMEVMVDLLSGTVAASNVALDIPQVAACPSSVCSVDTSKVAGTSTENYLGMWSRTNSTTAYTSSASEGYLFSDFNDLTTLFISNTATSAGNMGKTNGNAMMGTGNGFFARFTVPIVGWTAGNKKLIVPSADTNQAGFFGSVKWDTTASCGWTRTSTTIDSFAVDAQCDDNTRTILGNTNITNGDVGNADGQLPQIKFSSIPAGTLKCEARGHLAVGGGTAKVVFNDGTTSTVVNRYGASETEPSILGEFHYDTAQGETTIQLHVGSTASTVTVELESTDKELEISCYYYPPHDRQPKINYLFPTVDYSWTNEFSAKVVDGASTTTVSNENEDFIDGNCTNPSAGEYTCNFVSGVFTSTPNCQLTVASAATNAIRHSAITTSSITISSRTATTGGASDTDFNIQCSRTGSDYRLGGTQAAILAPEDGMYGVLMTDGAADSDADLDIAANMTDLGGSGTEWQSVVTDGISVGAGGLITLPATKATYSVIMKAGVAVTTGSSKTVSMQMLQGDGAAYSIVPFSRSEVVGNSGDSLLLSINTRIRVTGSTDNKLKIQMSNSGSLGDAVLRSNRTTGVADAPGFVIYITQQR